MIILHKKILFLLLLVPLFSCTTKEKNNAYLSFMHHYKLQHKSYDVELLISRGDLAVIDSFLIIISSEPEAFCKVYSIPNAMKHIYNFGRIGNGPGEFLQPLLTYSHGNTFGLNEVNKQELAIMQLINDNGKVYIIEKERLKAPYRRKKGELVPPDYFFTRLNSDKYVSLLIAEDGRFFSLLDSTLSHINQFGESPIAEKIEIISARNRLQGRISAHEGTMVFATSQLPYLSCYQLNDDTMKKQWSLFYNEPYYGVRNGDLLFSKEKSYGKVIDLKMDSKFIYLLYLDQLLSEYDYNVTEKSHANTVLIFDFDGNPVASVHLSCRIYTMALSNDGRKLYGLADLPEPTIVEFEMPKQLINKK